MAAAPRTFSVLMSHAFGNARAWRSLCAVIGFVFANAACHETEIRFEETTTAAGISYVGRSYTAAWGDWTGNGLPDLWVGHHGLTPSLLRNNGDGTFTDFGEPFAVPRDAHGASWVDYDNDGDQDLWEVIGQGGQFVVPHPNRFFVNETGLLIEQAAALGLDADAGRGRTGQWWDFDGDGWLDAVYHAVTRPDLQFPSTLYLQRDGVFEATELLPETNLASRWSGQGHLIDLEDDGDFELVSVGALPATELYDTSEGPFDSITGELGFDSNFVGDAAVLDARGDPVPDLFVLRLTRTFPYVTQTSDTEIRGFVKPVAGQEVGFDFRGSAPLTVRVGNWDTSRSRIYIGPDGANPSGYSFDLDADNPGHQGLANFFPEEFGVYFGYDTQADLWRVRVTGRLLVSIESSAPLTNLDVVGFENTPPQGLQDDLYVWDDGSLVEEAIPAGFDEPTPCFSVVAADFDNDMDQDLYMACAGTFQNIPNRLYANQGDGTFELVEDAGGAAGSELGQGDVVAAADYDVDGFVDLFVTNGRGSPPFHDGPDQLFRNLGNNNHWVEIDLEGVLSNRDGIGTRVEVTAGGVTQIRHNVGGLHGPSQDHARLHFGLASHEAFDLRVEWPSGVVHQVENIPADQVLRVIEPAAPSALGAPTFNPGEDAGVFVWKESYDGPYRVHTSSDADAQAYLVQLVADEGLSEVTSAALEIEDAFGQTEFGLTLSSAATAGDADELSFELAPGARALLAVQQDGRANPRQLHVGAEGKALSPVGWILSGDELEPRPDFAAGVELGLFLGSGDDAQEFEARWNGDGLRHQAEFDLLASLPIAVEPVSVQNPNQPQGPNWIHVSSEVIHNWDGMRAELPPLTQLGIAYQQDGLFPPHRVNPMGPSLGMPNAYWLPVPQPTGTPQIPLNAHGAYLWLDDAGVWHLRARADASPLLLIGNIHSDTALVASSDMDLEAGDVLDVSDPQTVSFALGLAPGDEDEIQLEFPSGSALALDLLVPTTGAAELLRIGEAQWPVDQLPLELGAW